MIYDNTGTVALQPTWWFETENEAREAALAYKVELMAAMTQAGFENEDIPLNVHQLN